MSKKKEVFLNLGCGADYLEHPKGKVINVDQNDDVKSILRGVLTASGGNVQVHLVLIFVLKLDTHNIYENRFYWSW